jgi:ferric-dicitrate binding protein FerR (iron transport regulator)
MKNSKGSKALILCLIAAVLVVPATMAFTHSQPQSQQGPSGQLSVVGKVTINGTSAISGATVFSDSTVTTAKGSSAVVSLGKLGRVEVLPDTTMKLSFTDSSITVSMLDAGRVRVSSSSGTSATATTNDGQVVATGAKMNEFTVDTTCGNTFVAVKKGSVELRAGDSVKQIAAGGQDTAGTARPGCTPGGVPGRRQ